MAGSPTSARPAPRELPGDAGDGGDTAGVPIVRVLRVVWSAVVVVGCVLFLAANRSDLAGAAARGRTLDGWPIVVGVCLSSGAMLNRAGKSRAAHRAIGVDVPRWSMVPPTLVGFAADKIVRFGGLSGLAVMLKHGDRMGYHKASVVASTVVAKVANFLSLGLFLVAAASSVWLDGELTMWWLAAATGFGVYGAAVLAAFVGLARNRDRAERCWTWIERRVPNHGRSPDGPRPVATIWEGMRSARSSPALTAQVLLHAVLAKVLGVGLLVAASHAVEVPLALRDALVIYSTVLLASVASMMPAGVGAVEASALAVIVGGGTPVSEAVVMVALFRMFDLWLPLMVGGAAAVAARLWPPSPSAVASSNRPVGSSRRATDEPAAPQPPAAASL